MSYYNSERGYLKLLEDTLACGETKNTRNGTVLSRFGCIINFSQIYDKFPLLTTKRMFFRGIVEELLWFLKGSTNANDLKEKGIHIWDGNSSREYLDNNGLEHYEEGELGPIYGWQWRRFGKKYKETDNYKFQGCDQLKNVLEELLKEDYSRRAIISSWNPMDIHEMALPPCHVLYSFYKSEKGLSCHMTMRSSDLFLGLPFNIASTALLTHIIAYVLHMKTQDITISLCDAHIYQEHTEPVKEQLKRTEYNLPQLKILKEPPQKDSSIEEKLKWIETLKYEDFDIINYISSKGIKAEMK